MIGTSDKLTTEILLLNVTVLVVTRMSSRSAETSDHVYKCTCPDLDKDKEESAFRPVIGQLLLDLISSWFLIDSSSTQPVSSDNIFLWHTHTDHISWYTWDWHWQNNGVVQHFSLSHVHIFLSYPYPFSFYIFSLWLYENHNFLKDKSCIKSVLFEFILTECCEQTSVQPVLYSWNVQFNSLILSAKTYYFQV